MHRKALVAGALAALCLALTPDSHAKTWTVDQITYVYTCEDERQVGARVRLNMLSTFTSHVIAREGNCLQACDSNPNCRTVNLRHVTSMVHRYDAYICTLYANAKTDKVVYKTVVGAKGGHWGAVCHKVQKKLP